MKFRGLAVAAVSVVLFGTQWTHASPIQLSRLQFSAAIAPLTPVIEDFEAFSVGNLTSPVTLANSTYTSVNPQIRLNWPNNPTQAMFENSPDPAGGRVFSGLLPGTTLFGIDVRSGFGTNSPEILDITVVGGSGVLSIKSSFGDLSEFFGVEDPLGLTSVSLKNVGAGESMFAWGMDNVTTAASASIPEASTLLLLSLGLVGLTASRTRQLLKSE